MGWGNERSEEGREAILPGRLGSGVGCGNKQETRDRGAIVNPQGLVVGWLEEAGNER